MYTNGEGFRYDVCKNGTNTEACRFDMTNDNYTDYDYLALAPVPRYIETHAGEDVGIYAIGT